MPSNVKKSFGADLVNILLIWLILGVVSLSCTLPTLISSDPYFTPPQTNPSSIEPSVLPSLVWQPTPAITDDAPTPPLTPHPTPNQPDPLVNTTPTLYYTQAGDTLVAVAIRFGVQPDEITSPDLIPESGFLNPSQLLVIPKRLANTTSPQHLIPDSEIVFSPSAAEFDVQAFVEEAGGYLKRHRDYLKSTGWTSGANIIGRVALENSINPRLLLALLEFRSGWVYGALKDEAQRDYAMGIVDPKYKGLYHQLVWAVNQLSIGYYGWREGRLTEIRFSDGVTARLAPNLNAGTAALQYFFAQLYDSQGWVQALDPSTGFPALYERMFGNAWARALTVEPLFPPGLTQPNLILPFIPNQPWAYTGGPHGAWERDGSYAAIDFGPGSDLPGVAQPGCVKSDAWVVASASGLVTRSDNGVVALDLDGDGREQTGWVLIYLHISTEDRVPLGQWVERGDKIGHPSCEGGFATGTHVHLARKYNGEWIAADGPLPFVLSGWTVHAGSKPYEGTMTRDGQTITASQLGVATSHIMRSPDDP